VSIAAQLATFPLSMYYFHQFPNYFLLANLLIVPLSTLVLYEGMILIIAGWIPAAETFMAFLLTWSQRYYNRNCKFT
jgi:competence protein ComEC